MQRIGSLAVVVLLLIGSGDRTSAQGRAPRMAAGCPLEPVQFHECALPRMKAFDPPRTPDGKPDLQGYWDRAFTSQDVEEHGSDGLNTQAGPSLVIDTPDHRIPYTPAAAAIKNQRYENRHHSNPKLRDPIARCLLAGVPRFAFLQPFRIIQNPEYVLFLYQYEHAFRVIPLNGGPHLAENIILWRGDSRGRWEGNTLVVDVTNHDARTWFDQAGASHSDALHVVERVTFVDANTINYEATLEDPKAYTRPWKIAFTHKRTAEQGFELLEDACIEGLSAAPH